MKKIVYYSVLFWSFALFLSGCKGIDWDSPNPAEVVGEGTVGRFADSENAELVYRGEGEVTRYNCHHTGKIEVTIKSDGKMVMTVTTPTVVNNCSPGNEFETAKIYGDVREDDGVLVFRKCNYEEIKPEGLGNYTALRVQGGVSCYNEGFNNKPEKWLNVVFDLPRVEK